MNRDDVLAKLHTHEPELKAAGIARLRLFGSVARGDWGDASDVDLLAEFDEGICQVNWRGHGPNETLVLVMLIDQGERGRQVGSLRSLIVRATRRLVIVINSATQQPTNQPSGQARQKFITLVAEELDSEDRRSPARSSRAPHR